MSLNLDHHNEFLFFSESLEIIDDDHNFATHEGVIGDAPYIECKARIFRTCTRGTKVYNEAALDHMVSAFAVPKGDSDWSTPIQLDHSESARDTFGNVRKLWRQGKELFATLRFVGAEAVAKVKNKTWKRLSVGLRPNFSLREVSVTPFPWHTDAETFKEDIPLSTTAQTEAASAAAQTQAATTTAADTSINFAERLAEQERKLADQERKFAERTAALEAQAAQQATMLEKQATVIRFTELTAMVDKFSESGKTVPVMREKELAFIKTLSDEQLALFSELKDTQPKLIDYSKRGHLDFKAKPSANDDADSEAEADKLADDFGIPQKGKAKGMAGKGGC